MQQITFWRDNHLISDMTWLNWVTLKSYLPTFNIGMFHLFQYLFSNVCSNTLCIELLKLFKGQYVKPLWAEKFISDYFWLKWYGNRVEIRVTGLCKSQGWIATLLLIMDHYVNVSNKWSRPQKVWFDFYLTLTFTICTVSLVK